MLADLTGSQQLLKTMNRMALVRQICLNPGLSRADLASVVGLTKSTVSLLVRDLLNEGWLVERDVVATGDMGRRPTPLFVDPARLLMIGVEVGIESSRLIATSLTGEVLHGVTAQYGRTRAAAACISSVAKALRELYGQFPAGQQFLGIGVGLPGGVTEARGIVSFAPNLGWRDVPFAAMLAEELRGSDLEGIPLFLQNEADAAALGELEFNPTPDSDPLLYVSINQGLGAGVIVGGRLLTGSRGYAGEVGHMVLQFNGPRCSCGRRGCAEAMIATRAIQHGKGGNAISRSIPEVRADLAAQEPETHQAVAAAGHHLGMLLLNLAAAYDPGCIVLGGSVIELGDPLLQPALDVLDEFATFSSSPRPTVRRSRFGADAVAIGAAALVRYRLTRPALPMSGLKRRPLSKVQEVR
ncbi:ROK family protein [Roseateles sp. BYS78W]|uniref:ROK family protein n=1 Tax=Pelomonas candidula TaxID=3299025 RepID=A0ABW7HLG8_9BURK